MLVGVVCFTACNNGLICNKTYVISNTAEWSYYVNETGQEQLDIEDPIKWMTDNWDKYCVDLIASLHIEASTPAELLQALQDICLAEHMLNGAVITVAKENKKDTLTCTLNGTEIYKNRITTSSSNNKDITIAKDYDNPDVLYFSLTDYNAENKTINDVAIMIDKEIDGEVVTYSNVHNNSYIIGDSSESKTFTISLKFGLESVKNN